MSPGRANESSTCSPAGFSGRKSRGQSLSRGGDVHGGKLITGPLSEIDGLYVAHLAFAWFPRVFVGQLWSECSLIFFLPTGNLSQCAWWAFVGVRYYYAVLHINSAFAIGPRKTLGAAAKAGSDPVLTAHNTSVCPAHDNMQDGFPRKAAVPEFRLTTLTEGRVHRKDKELQED